MQVGITGGLVAEVRVVASHLLGRPADRALHKVSDVALQDCVRREAVRIDKALGFEELLVRLPPFSVFAISGLDKHLER
jgi:hypothetical protein